jgi:hypothetical protein
MTSPGGWEVAFAKCIKCGKFAGSLFSDGSSTWWAGEGVCEHGPHERPAVDDPRARHAISKTQRARGHPASLRVNPVDALS